MSILNWLSEWYSSNCDESWEHFYGVKIETLDNPGWSVTIDLTGTPLENRAFEVYEIDNGDDDWIRCRVRRKWLETNFDRSEYIRALDDELLFQIADFYRTQIGAVR